MGQRAHLIHALSSFGKCYMQCLVLSLRLVQELPLRYLALQTLDESVPISLFATCGMDVVIGGGVESISLVQNQNMRTDRAGDPWIKENKPALYMSMLETAEIVAERYGVSREDQDAYALQSRRGETQSADSFMRFLWPFGGSLLDANFKSNLNSKASQQGLQFRQDLMKFMPPGIVDYDHNEAVNALAQGKVAMITEWSAFYSTLADPSKSKITDCLAVATEPKGPAGLKPALGGFSLGVNANSGDKQKAAAWLFIQWVTSEAMAKPYLEAGGVSGRMSVYKDADVQKKYPFVQPMVTSWEGGVPDYRPRFPQWPEISEVVGENGTAIMLGKTSVQDGAKAIGTKMEDILKKAGYYDGKAKLLK